MILDQSLNASQFEEESSEHRLDKLLSVQEYAPAIYQYLRQAEVRLQLNIFVSRHIHLNMVHVLHRLYGILD